MANMVYFGSKDIVIEDSENRVCTRFVEEHGGKLIPRHQRDIARLIALIKACALLNCFTREKLSDNRIKATDEDLENGFRLYNVIALPNELGISPEIYDI